MKESINPGTALNKIRWAKPKWKSKKNRIAHAKMMVEARKIKSSHSATSTKALKVN